MEQKVLNLNFKDEVDKDFRLRIVDPRDGITEEEASNAMNTILAANVFSEDRDLAKVANAELVVTTSTYLYNGEA